MRKRTINIIKIWLIPLVMSLLVSEIFAQSIFYAPSPTHSYDTVIVFEFEKTTHSIELAKGEQEQPLYYQADIVTPVCDDSICAILHLTLYWDLLGDYMGFDTVPGFPLSKYNHILFNTQEYEQLHQILSDKSSSLKFLQMEDLVNNESKHTSGVVDAVSGATNVNIANAVVQGGVYSCYILWHVANYQVNNELVRYTSAMLNEGLKQNMLLSSNEKYHLYVLEGLKPSEFLTYKSDLLALISPEYLSTISFLIAHMPDEFLNDEEVQSRFCTSYSAYSAMMRLEFLQRLSSCECITVASIDLLSEELLDMSYMQSQEFAYLLRKYKQMVSPKALKFLEAAIADPEYKYASIVREVL